jgi:hypothetical protein
VTYDARFPAARFVNLLCMEEVMTSCERVCFFLARPALPLPTETRVDVRSL